ncbi:MAG TPA: ATP-binding protein [Ktedonobacteraceae bacterium]
MKNSWKTHIREIYLFVAKLPAIPFLGWLLAVPGTFLLTFCIIGIDTWGLYLFDPGLWYLPLVAMLAYHWGLRYALLAALVELLCVYIFFLPPFYRVKSLQAEGFIDLFSLAVVTAFVLLLVQLASDRRASAEHAVERLAALNRVGSALASELEEKRLLHLIAETACALTGATVAAFTLRPTDSAGQPLTEAEGYFFHLAAVIGVTPEQEELFRHTPLGGKGLLLPIFRHGIPVRVDDALDEHIPPAHSSSQTQGMAPTRSISDEALYRHGLPKGHPLIHSFLGVPLLNREREVIGGLLLGHHRKGQFTHDHERFMVGLAAQAAIALENARLYHMTQMRAQELNAIFEGISDGVVLVDTQGQVLRENNAAQRIREVIQTSDKEKQALSQLLTLPAQQAGVQENGYEDTVCIAGEEGECHDYQVKASPLYASSASATPSEKALFGTVITWHDVSEARRLIAERRAYAESESRRALLQLVLNELPGSVYLVRGSDARLVLANRATATVWGATWEHDQPMSEFLMKNGIRVSSMDGLSMPLTELATIRAVQRGETVYQHQEVIRHADSSSLPVLVNAVALPSEKLHLPADSGRMHEAQREELAALVIHQDLTALKEAEHLKDEFIGIAAHELRTPLAVLKGSAQTLVMQSLRGHGTPLVDWQLESLEGIEQATDRLIELTTDLLDVTRLQGGRLALHCEPLNLLPLVERIVKRLQLTTQKHRLVFSAEPEPQIVYVDPQRMEQVLSNLLGNAIKYSPDGGTIEVALRLEESKPRTIVSIRDYGIGIPAQQQAQLFGRFVRADNARMYGIGGTGLGLYLCRELIERQGGRIWFESVEGEGSVFSISLPLVESLENVSEEEA